MDWWGRFSGLKKWFLAAPFPFLEEDRLWAVALFGIVLIAAVCLLAFLLRDDDIETPILTVRRGKSKRKDPKDEEKSEEPEEKRKDDAKAS